VYCSKVLGVRFSFASVSYRQFIKAVLKYIFRQSRLYTGLQAVKYRHVF